jgi:P-type conjugative transfer protein TrbJ
MATTTKAQSSETSWTVRSLSWPSRLSKSNAQSLRKAKVGCAVIAALFLTTTLHSEQAIAQWLVTNPASDALTVVNQVSNYAMAGQRFAKQAMQYTNQIQQYQTMLKNLEENPKGLLKPDLNRLVEQSSKLMATGKSIGNGMAGVGDNIDRSFKNTPGTYSQQFRSWTNSNQDTLRSSMLNAGLHRENFASDTAAIQALVDKNQASGGSLAATKTLGEINSAQLMESVKLRELISSQQIAVNTQLIAVSTKEQAERNYNADVMGRGDLSVPKIRK